MKFPIIAYGDPVLRKKCEPVDQEYPKLGELVASMFETMYEAQGVGLAAPQIGKAIRIFVIDSEPMMDEEEEGTGVQQVFINAEMIAEEGEPFAYSEGCLSIPDIAGDVVRKPDITIRYINENWETVEQQFSGMTARVIQHEYDHIEGKLFTDYLKPLKKRLIKGKLDKISKGKIDTRYRMRFPKK